MTKVLIVDDDPVQLRLTLEAARKSGFDVLTATSGTEALTLLSGDRAIGAMVLDLVMPDLDGMSVLEQMQQRAIKVPVVVQTAHSSLEVIVSAMRLGASDFFVKPVAPERLAASLNNVLKIGQLETCIRTERARRSGTLSFSDIIARSPVMARTLELAGKAARSTIPVLIEGESGVVKEIFARAIQGSGERAGKPFITVNCGAIPAELVESTLFGHAKGAFTGAHADHDGKFFEAHGGTLFLDEIGELPADAQVKLLRALQEGEIEPVGASRPVKVNVRLISATNRRLLSMAQAGTFREDLYYRLNVFPIYVPPLRQRMEDIPTLTDHFVTRFASEAGRKITGLSPKALSLLQAYSWPGNIRQLENAVYRAVVLAESDILLPADFPQIVAALNGTEDLRRDSAARPGPKEPIHIDQAVPTAEPASGIASIAPAPFLNDQGDVMCLAEMERQLIAYAIAHHNGHMSKVAKSLGIGRSTLYRKLKEYGLDENGAHLAA